MVQPYANHEVRNAVSVLVGRPWTVDALEVPSSGPDAERTGGLGEP